MMFFPQLTTGAATQLPVERRRSMRTVVNAPGETGEVKYVDAGARTIEWDLRLRGLTDGERAAIEALFKDCRGPLETFTFLDPLANLLADSGDLQQTSWTADPGLALVPGVADPVGTTGAVQITNAGQVAQRIIQAVAGQAGFQYCMSVFVRSAGGVATTLLLGCGSNEERHTCTAGQEWRRVSLAARPGSDEESIYCGLELPAGASVQVFGMQLEAQPSASGYKPTVGRGGVYPRARFSEDSLAAVAEGPDNHSIRLRITSAMEA